MCTGCCRNIIYSTLDLVNQQRRLLCDDHLDLESPAPDKRSWAELDMWLDKLTTDIGVFEPTTAKEEQMLLLNGHSCHWGIWKLARNTNGQTWISALACLSIEENTLIAWINRTTEQFKSSWQKTEWILFWGWGRDPCWWIQEFYFQYVLPFYFISIWWYYEVHWFR